MIAPVDLPAKPGFAVRLQVLREEFGQMLGAGAVCKQPSVELLELWTKAFQPVQQQAERPAAANTLGWC
jgi:hypothetical protein